ncbi:DUF6608 family protein [Evansella tamaricis]|uniref:Uncharacterized protein n=1 Tax=Evansella tamaricis TaxID=2069301 RepID=A0ABS6JE07_9BACI|nr:DUF6608 family protein [Evansella tamaricis]MBU9711901.1 hypothetical protein [Evansella tamaricis]
MKDKLIGVFKHGFLLFCIIFAMTTLVSSPLQLLNGQTTDTNFHILNRAVIVFIAVITILLFLKIKLKSKVLTYFVPYVISMVIVFFYVWLTGFFVSLHPDAYRDIFFNFTGVTICVVVVLLLIDRTKNKKRKMKNIA